MPRPPRLRSARAQSPRPRLRRPHGGCAVAAPGLYVWEATAAETAWARELAEFARALRIARRG